MLFRSVLGSWLLCGLLAACSGEPAATEAAQIGIASLGTLQAALSDAALSPATVSPATLSPETTSSAPARAAHRADDCGDHADDDAPELREHASHPVSWHSHTPKGPRGSVRAKILGFNDFHGQLSEGKLAAGRPVGGAAVLATYLKTSAAGFAGRSLILHAGDQVGASPPESALLQDEPSIQFLNALTNRHCRGARRTDERCNVVGTAGNHEFDEGTDELLRLIYGGNHEQGPFLEEPYRGARFPYVSANVAYARGGRSLLPPYVIRDLGGVRVGVIGAVLKETPTIVTPTGVAGLEFLDEATAVNAQVAKLKRQGVHTIILTIHQGARQTPIYDTPTDPAASLGTPISDIVARLDDEVDLVISGHSHTFSNALLKTPSGHEILVTQAFSASTAYADIDLEIDRASGDVLSKTARVLTTYSDVAPGNVRDPDVQSIVDAARAEVAPLVNQVIAQVSADATTTLNPAGESTLGNLIADAQRSATGTDFAFMNPGGIRADLLFAANPANPLDVNGSVVWGELFSIQPFGNSLVTMTLTGQQVYDLLEQQFAVSRFLQTSGLEYSWDNRLPLGSRVVEVRKAGVPIDRLASYGVTVNNFIAAGGDGFTALLAGTNQVGGAIDLDALISYLAAAPQPVAVPPLGRVTRLD